MAPDVLFQIAEPGEARVKHACRTNAVGIDLGTTNSLVAIVDAGKPVCLADERSGSTIVPSVVHYAANGDVVVGAEARACTGRQPLPEGGIAPQLHDPPGGDLRAGRGNEEPGLAVDHDLRGAVDVGRDHRDPGRHRLQHGARQALEA